MYFHGLTTRFDQLALLGKPLDQEDQIEHIVEGLPEDYKTVADQIVGREAPPSLTEIHEKLLNHEAKLQLISPLVPLFRPQPTIVITGALPTITITARTTPDVEDLDVVIKGITKHGSSNSLYHRNNQAMDEAIKAAVKYVLSMAIVLDAVLNCTATLDNKHKVCRLSCGNLMLMLLKRHSTMRLLGSSIVEPRII